MKIGCVILAGGKSSRMGTDKALLEMNGTNFIRLLADRLDPFEEKLIARGSNSEITDIGWTLISDVYPRRGPLGGLQAALSVCRSDALLCISCDMPLFQYSLAQFLCSSLTEGYDAVVAKEENGRVHPLCAVYRKSAAEMFEKQILSGNNRMMHALEQMRVRYVTIDFARGSGQLLNVNTPEEYQLVLMGGTPHD